MTEESMNRSGPKSINYQDTLPMSVPAIARRRRFFPVNGPTFDFLGTDQIRIEIESTNSLCDVLHSYLEFDVTNNSGLNLGWEECGAPVMFDRVSVEQGGRELSSLNAYNRLHAGVISSAQQTHDGAMTESITAGQRGHSLQAPAAQVNQMNPYVMGAPNTGQMHGLSGNDVRQFPNGTTARFTMPILSGLFKTDKLLPLPLVKQGAPITLVLSLTNPLNVGVWSGVPAFNSLPIVKCSYVAQLIEVGRDVIDQIRTVQADMGGQLAISSTDIEHNVGNLPATSVGDTPIRLPLRKRSMKSLWFLMQSDDYANGAAGLGPEDIYNMAFSGNANMDSYRLQVGSVSYPPEAINCWGNVAVAAGANAVLADCNRSECAMELAKSFGSLAFTSPTGTLCTNTYGTNATAIAAPRLSDGDNGDGAGPPGNTQAPGTNMNKSVCPFGLDLDAFAQHVATQGGVDTETLSLESNLILNINAVTAGLEDKNVHMWVLYDQHYYFNANGMITYSN